MRRLGSDGPAVSAIGDGATVLSPGMSGEGEVSLAWLLHRDALVVPIVGTRSVDHLESDLAAADLTLDRFDETVPRGSVRGTQY